MLNELERKVALCHEIHCIIPKKSADILEQIRECYENLNSVLAENGLSKSFVVKQIFFVNSQSNIRTIEIQNYIKNESNQFFNAFVPLSVVSQPPLENVHVVAEFTIVHYPDIKHIEFKEADGIKYLSIETNSFIQIIGSGMGEIKEFSNIYSQGILAFEQAEKILKNEQLDFSNIVRQWNYIEDIVGYTDENQHYQIFNDIRTTYYDKYLFKNGYPSATGIGMENGGVVIDFIAIKEKSDISIIPIKSPVQTDAHRYSKEVLAHNEMILQKKETTPKFERAKAIIMTGSSCIYVSGTAAIKGQDSIKYNASEQTSITIENIFKLVSAENLKSNGISNSSSSIFPLNFRVYIKDDKDIEEVKKVCQSKIGDIETLFVKADICRPELLVEIEAFYGMV